MERRSLRPLISPLAFGAALGALFRPPAKPRGDSTRKTARQRKKERQLVDPQGIPTGNAKLDRRRFVRGIYMEGERQRQLNQKPDQRPDKYLHSHARRRRQAEKQAS